jgi:hypothetical protein
LIPFVVSLLVVVKVPVPEPPAPAMVHVPVIAFAAPVRSIVSPGRISGIHRESQGAVHLAVGVSTQGKRAGRRPQETKHGELPVKVNLEMLSVPPPFTTSDLPRVDAGRLFESVNVAFHVP